MKALTVGVTTIVMASLAAWTMAADEIGAVLQNSFVARNQATMDRLERDAVQTACSAPRACLSITTCSQPCALSAWTQ